MRKGLSEPLPAVKVRTSGFLNFLPKEAGRPEASGRGPHKTVTLGAVPRNPGLVLMTQTSPGETGTL